MHSTVKYYETSNAIDRSTRAASQRIEGERYACCLTRRTSANGKKKCCSNASTRRTSPPPGRSCPNSRTASPAYLGVPSAVAVQSGTAAFPRRPRWEIRDRTRRRSDRPGPLVRGVSEPRPYAGATPVLVDVDPETWTLDTANVRKALTPRTKAVIPVHIYGNPCDMDALFEICEQRKIRSSKTPPKPR